MKQIILVVLIMIAFVGCKKEEKRQLGVYPRKPNTYVYLFSNKEKALNSFLTLGREPVNTNDVVAYQKTPSDGSAVYFDVPHGVYYVVVGLTPEESCSSNRFDFVAGNNYVNYGEVTNMFTPVIAKTYVVELRNMKSNSVEVNLSNNPNAIFSETGNKKAVIYPGGKEIVLSKSATMSYELDGVTQTITLMQVDCNQVNVKVIE